MMYSRLWRLFIDMFSISATANSGYAMLAVIRNRFTDRYGWLKEEEMDDLIALAQSSPGPIAVNVAILAGYQIAGTAGAFACVAGAVMPPFIIMILVHIFYGRIISDPHVRIFISGMQAGVCAMLLDIVISLFSGIAEKKQLLYPVLTLLSFLCIRCTDISVSCLALICIAAGIVKTLVMKRKAQKDG